MASHLVEGTWPGRILSLGSSLNTDVAVQVGGDDVG
jgi:hypothetical protein